MRTIKRFTGSVPILAALLIAGAVVAQHEGHQGHQGHEGHQGHDKAPAKTEAPARIGDAYTFDTCPISGKKLGSMGDAVVKLYSGREVRYCCGGCPKRFEKDLVASFAKLDALIIKDQMALYPLKTSVVTGKGLPKKPTDFVSGNRLIRVGSAKEKAEFEKTPRKFFVTLDKAVVAAQGKDYVLKECPVSGEEFGGVMGKPVDLVVAGRLVRVCCKDCKGDVEKAPSKFVGQVDAARKSKMKKGEVDHSRGHDHKGGSGK